MEPGQDRNIAALTFPFRVCIFLYINLCKKIQREYMYAYYGEVMEINKIEQELLKLITKAKDKNEVPIAALIVKNDKIISKFYNKVNKSNNILDHAEILVIKKASKKLHNWRLDDCDLYVTLEPCSMCKEVIRKSRIKNTYYFINQNEHLTEKEPNFIKIEDKINFSNKLTQFFKDKR